VSLPGVNDCVPRDRLPRRGSGVKIYVRACQVLRSQTQNGQSLCRSRGEVARIQTRSPKGFPNVVRARLVPSVSAALSAKSWASPGDVPRPSPVPWPSRMMVAPSVSGRSRSFLAAEAINEYLDLNEWQVAGIQKAVASLDRGEGIPHKRVKEWVGSWNSKKERPAPKRSAT
jgi:RHH-type transcriptional regulator, rel operon repressor / antitoxin RelB